MHRWAPSPPFADRGTIMQTIVALGKQDTSPEGLTPPVGMTVIGSSSDHLILETPTRLPAGTELRFGLDYEGLLRAMTSPFVAERPLATLAAAAVDEAVAL